MHRCDIGEHRDLPMSAWPHNRLKSQRADAHTPLKVLVVDDDPGLLDEMATTLVDEGYGVLQAADGAAAIKHIESNAHIGVLVTDVRMPGLDGLQLIQQVLARLPVDTPGPQIVVITGHGTMETVVDVLRLRAADFLCKPVARDDLVSTIRRAMDKSESARGQRAEQDEARQGCLELHAVLDSIKANVNRLMVSSAEREPIESKEDEPPLPTTPEPVDRLRAIRAMLLQQKVRDRVFGESVAIDPTWNMLLDLMLAHIEDRPMYLTSLCVSPSMPMSSALRRVEHLIAIGLVQRRDDEADRRRVIVSLTEAGLERLSTYFEQAERALAPQRAMRLRSPAD